MYRPFVIDFNYKIINNASGQISRTFWEHVPNDQFSPTIMCSEQQNDFKSTRNAVPVKDHEFIRYFLSLIKKLGFPDLYYVPDTEFFSWGKFVIAKACRLLKSGNFDYLHTISSPQSTHLVGLKLKEQTGLPWIAQFNDPWHDSSGRKYKFSYFSNKDVEMERKVAENADLIVHSNKVIIDIWTERYGPDVAKKMVIVPFSFNIYNLPKIAFQNKVHHKITISHIGNIYSTRSSITIIDAVHKLLKLHPEFSEELKVNFIGGVHHSEKEYVIDLGLSNNINYLGTIAPEDLETYYLQSDIFLIIDVKIKRNPNYPSKLMMYYYYRKPILGITTPASQLEEELINSNHAVFYYGEIDKIVDYLFRALTNYNSLLDFKKDYWKQHTVENVTNIYKGIVNQLISDYRKK